MRILSYVHGMQGIRGYTLVMDGGKTWKGDEVEGCWLLGLDSGFWVLSSGCWRMIRSRLSQAPSILISVTTSYQLSSRVECEVAASWLFYCAKINYQMNTIYNIILSSSTYGTHNKLAKNKCDELGLSPWSLSQFLRLRVKC